MGNRISVVYTNVKIETRDEPVEGFVVGVGDILHYDGEIVGPVNNVMVIEEHWPVSIVPGVGAFCACNRCTGEYTGHDANSYGRYGYRDCLSVLDDPSRNPNASQYLLDIAYQAWARDNPELSAKADLKALRELVRRFLDRRANFADLRREAAKWGA